MAGVQAPAESEGSGRRAAPSFTGPRIVAALVIAAGGFLLYHALQIGATLGYSVVGPSVIPIVVSLGLLVLGLAFAARTTVVADRDLAVDCGEQEAVTHWPTVLLLIGLLVGYAFLLGPLGYIVATALLLPVAARILGSRSVVRDVAVGIGLALIIYFGFTSFLQIRLPQGILGPLI